MNNDFELVYWYQNCYQHSLILKIIFKKYSLLMKSRSLIIFHKFFYLPFTVETIFGLHIEIIDYSLQHYKASINKSFKNYLMQNHRFLIFNFISKTLRHECYKKDYYHNEIEKIPQDNNFLEELLYNSVQEYRLKLIYNHLDCLSRIEKLVLQLRLQNFGIKEIVEKTNFSYKKVDNALHRGIYKLKNIFLQEGFHKFSLNS